MTKLRQAMTKMMLGAPILASALMSGCVYSRTSAGPEAWGWSVGFGGTVGGMPGVQVEIPLRSADGEECLTIRGGGEMYEDEETDDLVMFQPVSMSTVYEEDYCISYRRYFGRGAPGLAALRPFLEAGLSVGLTLRGHEGGFSSYEETEKLNHLSLGLGVRWRPYATNLYSSDGPRNAYIDLSVNHVSRVDTTVGIGMGWSFGRSSGDGFGLAPSGGMRSAGPRMGMVYVTGEAADQLEAAYGLGPVLTTIGWQFEYQYASVEGGPTGLVEFIPLVTGLESELSLVSMNVLFGVRSPTEWEFMVGPYISETGHGMTFAVGKTARMGRMAMPMNLGITGTAEGPRVSFTFGWNIGR